MQGRGHREGNGMLRSVRGDQAGFVKEERRADTRLTEGVCQAEQ